VGAAVPCQISRWRVVGSEFLGLCLLYFGCEVQEIKINLSKFSTSVRSGEAVTMVKVLIVSALISK